MKVAYLTGLYPKVSHTFIRREIEGLEAAGFQVDRYSTRRNLEPLVDPSDREEQHRTRVVLDAGPAGLLLAALRAGSTRPRRFFGGLRTMLRLRSVSPRGLLAHVAYLFEASWLLFDFERRGIQHLHVHFANNPASVALLCRHLGGPPFSFTVHSPESSENPGQVSLREKVEQAEFVVAVSARGRAQILHWIGADQEPKVQVIKTGIGAQFLEQERPAIPEEPVFVAIGRLSPEKGHLVLLDAFRRVASSVPRARLNIVGDGPLRARLEAAAAQAGLTDRVDFAGNLNEQHVRSAILDSRALVLSSFHEGLPVVVLEALALGRPVIATAVGAVHEVLEPGRSGWIVPSGSADCLAQALEEAAHVPAAQLEEMGRAGRNAVARLHAVQDQVSQLAALIKASHQRRMLRDGGSVH